MLRNKVGVALGTLLTVLVVASTGVPAAADPGGGGKSSPSTVERVPTGRACTEHSGNKQGRDEYASCVGVTARLDRAPSLGQTATLTATVSASVPLPPADITIELPAQLAWDSAPAGFTADRVTSLRPERSGTIATARRTLQLTPGRPMTLTGTVKAVAAGYGEIEVRATATRGTDSDAGRDIVFLTVGAKGQPSRLGAVAGKTDLTVATLPAPPKAAARPAWQQNRSVGTQGLGPVTARRADAAPLACDSHVTGQWGYFDQDGVFRNPPNFQVQVRDLARGTLFAGVTDFGGRFNFCFDSSVATQLYLTFVAENSMWRVQNGANVYNWSTGVVHNPAPGSTVDFGSMIPGSPDDYRAVHAFDEGDDSWLSIPKPNTSCWDQKETACRQVRINWPLDSAHTTTQYDTVNNTVYLEPDDPNAPIVVAHEIGHAVMDDLYNDAFPDHPNCVEHFLEITTNAGCAWVEGFADWFALTANHSNFFRWPTGESVDLESPTWGSNFANGDTNEARVVGALLDIADFTNEGLWDRSSEGTANIWFVLNHSIDNNFASFWSDRARDGFDVSDTGALASLYQNTIDYGFREPLADRTLLQRPIPTPHNFSFSTSTPYWTVVGVIPFSSTDEDLSLYDDRAQTVFLGGSVFGLETTDFVAVDSNRRTFGDYYPRVNHFSGIGGYDIEVAQGGGATLVAGVPMTVSMPNDLVAVRDTFLSAGVPVTLSITPAAGQNVDLFLMGDNPNDATTFVRGRSAAVASSTSGGAGAAETLTYTPTVTGWFGVVITQRGGTGDVNLTRA